MRSLLIHWLVKAVALLLVAQVLPGIQVANFGAAMVAAAVIGLISATLGLVLKLVFLPFILLTLGVVYFLINGLMLKVASGLVNGFKVHGCMTAVIGSVLLTVVDFVLNRLLGA